MDMGLGMGVTRNDAAKFSPTSLPGLIGAYSAKSLAGSVVPGARVETLPDLGGVYDLSQANSSKRPLYNAGGGVHWVEADDAARSMECTGVALASTTSIVIAARITAAATSSSSLLSVNSSNDFQIQSGGGGTFQFRVNSSGLALAVLNPGADYLDQDVVCALTFDAATGGASVRINGTQVVAASNYNGSLNTDPQHMRLFATRGGGNGAQGRSYALAVWSSADLSDIEAAENWAAGLAGISL